MSLAVELYQMVSPSPPNEIGSLVGPGGLEPPTKRL